MMVNRKCCLFTDSVFSLCKLHRIPRVGGRTVDGSCMLVDVGQIAT